MLAMSDIFNARVPGIGPIRISSEYQEEKIVAITQRLINRNMLKKKRMGSIKGVSKFIKISKSAIFFLWHKN